MKEQNWQGAIKPLGRRPRVDVALSSCIFGPHLFLLFSHFSQKTERNRKNREAGHDANFPRLSGKATVGSCRNT